MGTFVELKSLVTHVDVLTVESDGRSMQGSPSTDLPDLGRNAGTLSCGE